MYLQIVLICFAVKINGVREAVAKRLREGVYTNYEVPSGGRQKKTKK